MPALGMANIRDCVEACLQYVKNLSPENGDGQ
jgi:hypothetical protein